MTWQQTIEDEKEDAYEEGLEDGIQQKALEAARTLVQKYNVTPEEAAKDMNAPLDLVLAELNKFTLS